MLPKKKMSTFAFRNIFHRMNASDSIVIIPTYNEKENIEKIIRAVFGLEKQFHILVIDDGSPDGTAQIVKGLMDGEFGDRLFLMERSGKLGLGTAYIAGFKWALERDYEYIFEMDADFSHDPNDLPRLYSACADEGYDLSIGSRNRLALYLGRECGELADGARVDELFCLDVCAPCDGL